LGYSTYYNVKSLGGGGKNFGKKGFRRSECRGEKKQVPGEEGCSGEREGESIEHRMPVSIFAVRRSRHLSRGRKGGS